MQKRQWDTVLYDIAENQVGYFTAAQARTAGLHQVRLVQLARQGAIERVSRGVYSLTRFPVSQLGHYMEAVLWPQVRRPDVVGVISHESALAIHELSDVNPARIPKQATHFVLTHATTQSAPWRYLRGHGGAPAQPVPTAVGGTKGDCWHVPRLLRAFSSARSRSSTLRASAEIGFSRYATTNSAALRISSESVTSARLRRMSQVFCNATDFPLPVAP